MKSLLTLLLLAVCAMPVAAQTYTGTLGPDSPRREFGEPYDTYSFDVEQGQQVIVEMRGRGGLDTYLIVRSPSGVEWVNDDFEWSTDLSRVVLTATEAGSWEAIASAFSEEHAGPYELTITLGEIADVTTLTGRLDTDDPQSIKGEYYDTLTIEPPAEGTFTVELITPTFDGFLRVTSPSGTQWRNDDAESTSVARIENLPALPGAWTVDVTSVAGEEVGDYVVNVIVYPEE